MCTLFFTVSEVPATKLAALQKVLQSEFLNAVREVYEHVYETVDVQGNPEIRASATAKVTHKPSCISYLKHWLSSAMEPRYGPTLMNRIKVQAVPNRVHSFCFSRQQSLLLPLVRVTPTLASWSCPRRRRASDSTSWAERSRTRRSTFLASFPVEWPTDMAGSREEISS